MQQFIRKSNGMSIKSGIKIGIIGYDPKGEPGIDGLNFRDLVEEIGSFDVLSELKPDVYRGYDVIVVMNLCDPSRSFSDNGRIVDGLRWYVECGGKLILYHAAVGYFTSNMSVKDIAPEIARGPFDKVTERRLKTVRRHPVTRGFQLHSIYRHAFFVRFEFALGPQGIALMSAPSGNGVIVCGEIGRGRIVFNGTQPFCRFMKDEGQYIATDKRLFKNTVRWLVAPRRKPAARRRIIRIEKDHSGTTVWRRNPWILKEEWLQPEPSNVSCKPIRLHSGQNEYVSSSILVTAGDAPEDIAVGLTVAGLRRDDLTVREVGIVASQGGRRIGDPLIENQANLFHVCAHTTKEIWLTIHTKNIAAGTYRGSVDVRFLRNGSRRVVPLSLRVFPVMLPAKAPFSVFAWGMIDHGTFEITREMNNEYTQGPSVVGVQEKYLRDMLDHKTNAFVVGWCVGQHIPWPMIQNGKIMGLKNIDGFRRAVLLKNKGFLIFELGTHLVPNVIEARFGVSFEKYDQWRGLYCEWLKRLIAEIGKLGLTYKDFAFYPVDESLDDRFVKLASLIRQTDGNVRIFADSGERIETMKRVSSLIDIWCPHTSVFVHYLDSVAYMKKMRKIIWVYECYSMKGTNPSSFYRVLAWYLLRYDLDGVCFHGYDTWRGNPWTMDEKIKKKTGRDSTSVIYNGSQGPVSSKRWEAWREGLQDVCYMLMYKKQIAGQPTTMRKRLEREYQKCIDRVFEYQAHPDVIDDVRRRILKCVIRSDDRKQI